ncbi:uncharacterized protein LOC133180702 [Saccostrea echinata]|uniref:uncharacterized protein LOC133180702 n=1 Tax=Saccostrea echinata TaxID=191078 RepID=UPI002A83C446|nr:uncharacterized protein LOC133180702 [Saccostrea echinata]
MADVKETNFLKLVWLLMKYGAKVLQHRIEFELRTQKGQKLCDFLEEKKHEIFHLTVLKKCCKCPEFTDNKGKPRLPKDVLEQLYQNVDQCCLPRFRGCCCCKLSPHTDLNINVTKLDITLTSCLLINFLIEDSGQKQVIENIRKLRNDKELLHRGNAEVDNDRFEKLWLQLSNAIKEVVEKCEPYVYAEIKEEVDRLKTSPLCKEDTILSIKAWKEIQEESGSPVDRQHSYELYQRMTQFCCDVESLTTQLQEVRFPKTDPELENLLSYTESQLKAHEEKIYVEPKRAMQHCIKHLGKHRFICITGEAGSGKTSFGLQLMQHIIRKNQNCVSIILTDSSQWFKFISWNKKFVIFIDDIIGKSSLSERDFEEWRKVFDAMHLRVSDDKFPTFIIFSFRNCIWGTMKDVLKNYILFNISKTSFVDLSGSDFGMTFKEKKSMLYRFCNLHQISICMSEFEENRSFEDFGHSALYLCEKTLNHIAKMETVSGFPLLCEEFFNSPESLKQRSNFFTINSARIHFKKLVDDLLFKRMYLQYVMLVFFFLEVLIEQSYTLQEIMKLKSKIKDIAKKIDLLHHVSHQINKATIQGTLCDMKNTFIQINDDRYKLKHMVVYEAILLSFGESFPSSFLELVSKNDVFTYVRSQNYKPEKWEICVHLEDDMTESLARKLIEIYAPNTFDAYTVVYKHPSFNDEHLVSCFLDIAEKDVEFGAFLDSFVAGACSYKKDKLASETVKKFSSFLSFDFEIFNVILTHDLIDTFNQFIDNSEFRKLLMAHLLEEKIDNNGNSLYVASISGSRRCFLGMLDLLLSRDDDLETDGERQFVLSKEKVGGLIFRILSQHDGAAGTDWREALTKLTELLPSEKDKQTVYILIIENSILFRKFDVAQEYLQLITSFTSDDVFYFMNTCIIVDGDEFFNVLSKKLKALKFVFNSNVLALLAIFNARHNENMVMKVLHEFNDQCNYTCTDIDGSTVLHACEENHFSDANLLFILQRPEGEFMFTSVNDKGLTPVQCRESYNSVSMRSQCVELNRTFSMRGGCRYSSPRVRSYLSMENIHQYSHSGSERKFNTSLRYDCFT